MKLVFIIFLLITIYIIYKIYKTKKEPSIPDSSPTGVSGVSGVSGVCKYSEWTDCDCNKRIQTRTLLEGDPKICKTLSRQCLPQTSKCCKYSEYGKCKCDKTRERILLKGDPSICDQEPLKETCDNPDPEECCTYTQFGMCDCNPDNPKERREITNGDPSYCKEPLERDCTKYNSECCNGRGSIEIQNGIRKCICRDGWKGPNCEYNNENKCNGNGTLKDDLTCECKPNFINSDGLMCNKCSQGFYGPNCNLTIDNWCNNRGIPTNDGSKCVCFARSYYGTHCDEIKCNGRGDVVLDNNGNFVGCRNCDSGYFGNNCDITNTTTVFTSSGNGTILTSNFNKVIIEIIGAGGRGGNGSMPRDTSRAEESNTKGGGGGGAGEIRKIELNYSDVAGRQYSYTIGGSGTDTTFTINNQTYIAKAGNRGEDGITAVRPGRGGTGGAGGTGGISYPGNNGQEGGAGGSTIFGDGGSVSMRYPTNRIGKGPGAGGAGGWPMDSGGAGASGGVRITYI